MNTTYEQLALALYRVTEHMPHEEPLRMRIRETCLSVAESSDKNSEEALEFLNSLLSLAEKQEWGIDPNNFVVLRIEFSRLSMDSPSEVLAKKATVPVQEVVVPHETPQSEPKPQKIKESSQKTPTNLSVRQKKILDFLKNNDMAQIKNLQHLFPGLSPRTIRRDLDDLVKGHILRKSGKTNGTAYTLIRT